MSVNIKIKKGADIKLVGKAEKIYADAPHPETVAIKPPDFTGIFPKLVAREGDEVKAGDTLFYDKNNEKVKFTSPVSGEVVEIKRGAKRKMLEYKVLADKEIKYKEFKKADPSTLKREEIVETLLESGLWPFIKMRPFDVIANPDDKPKSIFISAFDSAPLAPDNDFVVHGQEKYFQTGIDAVRQLTEGKVHLNVNGKARPADAFTNAKGVQINKISGPHPAGNVGVQIHHIDPLAKGDVIWTLKPQDIITIGRLFSEGKLDAFRIVAVSGSEIEKPKYFKTLMGVPVKSLVKDNLKGGKIRLVSGNPLSGTKVPDDSYLGFYDYQLTALPEGDEPEFMGWLAPGFDKFSFSRTFFSWLMPNKKYKLDTGMNGEERAFVVTGEYEKVFPMKIYPQHLVKALMIEDIELMENLGMYEVAPEDFALCEFACTSKVEVQKVVREGLEMARAELM